MGEVNLLKFLTEHVFLVALAAVSGTMLLWPAIRRSTGGPSISTLQATLLINQNALVLDVRDAAEYAGGHVLNSRHLALGELEARSSELEKYKAKPVIVVCETGNRSDKAVATLRKQGFGQVFSLSGGIGAWKQAGLPLEK
ncbi:MAG TPA: rhodanese-like domain-containing protein [Burkholderiales bacterium]|nr:rhodanese-like domain-containing protein [Burkholderiales bacterium]